MLPEYLLTLFFGVLFYFQVLGIKEIELFERKTVGMYIGLGIGCLVILGITVYYGNTFLHMVIGILGTLVFVASMYVTGLSKDYLYYYTPPRRFIGRKILIEDAEKVRLETFHKNKVVVRFVANSTERFLTMSKADELAVKERLDYNFRTVKK